MVYILLLVYSFLFGIRYSKSINRDLLNLPYWLLCVLNILIFGCRYRVGFDTINYMESWDLIEPLSRMDVEDFFGVNHAPLYGLLESLCKTISSQFFVLQLAVSTLFNVLLFIFLKKYASNPYYAYLIFFVVAGWYFNTDIMRESIAIVISACNIDNLIKRKYWRYYCLSLLALLFHYTAIITFFFPFVKNIRFNKYYFLYILFFVILIKFVADYFFSILQIGFLEHEILVKLEGLGRHNLNWFLLRMAKYVFLPMILLWYYNRMKNDSPMLESLVCVYIIFGIGILFYEVFFQRFANYAILPFVVLFTNTFFSGQLYKKTKGIIRSFALSILFVLYGYGYMNYDEYRSYYPYYSIFNPQTDALRESRVYEWRINN